MTKTVVIGHIGADATVNEVNGKKVINFNLAHSENWTDAQGERRSKTTWFQVAKWGDKTAVAQYLTKGTQVYVEGKVDVKTYEAKDGSTGAALIITATEIQLLGSGNRQSENQAAPAAAPKADYQNLPEDDGSLPF